jgi:hypothetical protein
MRTFRSPSGREWTADLYRAPSPRRSGSAELPDDTVVLRFRSGELVLDAARFPLHWEELPVAALVELLRQAQPPSLGLAGRDATVGRGDGAPA